MTAARECAKRPHLSPSRFSPQSPLVIDVVDFHKLYQQTVAVAGLTFSVQPGQILGLLGPNGAGKTTTMRAISGIIPPTQGRLLVAGHDVVQQPVAAKRELAYVHLAHVRGHKAVHANGESVSIAACAERKAFRADVSCALIASDVVDIEVASSAVERRWADAVGFFQVDDDPDFVARALRQHNVNR